MNGLESEIYIISVRYLDVCSPSFSLSRLGHFHLMNQYYHYSCTSPTQEASGRDVSPDECCSNSWAACIHKSDSNNSVLSAYPLPTPVLRSELTRDGLSGHSSQPYFLNPKIKLSDDVYYEYFLSPHLTPTKRKAVPKSMKFLSIGGITESKNYGITPT